MFQLYGSTNIALTSQCLRILPPEPSVGIWPHPVPSVPWSVQVKYSTIRIATMHACMLTDDRIDKGPAGHWDWFGTLASQYLSQTSYIFYV
jgi:hypothetical protein